MGTFVSFKWVVCSTLATIVLYHMQNHVISDHVVKGPDELQINVVFEINDIRSETRVPSEINSSTTSNETVHDKINSHVTLKALSLFLF